MYLKFYMNEEGKRVYTLKGLTPDGKPTQSAHPARFSPGENYVLQLVYFTNLTLDDKYSNERITTKKRFGLLPTQSPAHVL